MTLGKEAEIIRLSGRTGRAVGWVMVVLTFVFILLYAAALLGWLRPLADITMIARLEPIIFIIIGYYFARLPAQQNEQNLRQENDRLIRRSELSQNLKEQAFSERDAIEEKIKNARVALLTDTLTGETQNHLSPATNLGPEADLWKHQRSIETAVNILSS